VKPRVLIAGLSSIGPGVTVNEKSITGMHSKITKDVPEGSFVVGEDRLAKQWSAEELERHFGESKREAAYRKRFKGQVRAFRKDPTQMRLTVRYEGKRENPGNEWYLARPMLRIYYNAIFVELARLAPASWLRKLLLRCTGAKIGKGVYIGRNVVFDHIYGDLAVVEDGAHIGDNCYIDGHSYTITESVFGRIRIGKNARLENKVHLACGITVGDDATVRGPTSVMKDVPAGEAWAGMPAKKV
jgi:acetyltransferase-like isoleucine patch superfamily enzyme